MSLLGRGGFADVSAIARPDGARAALKRYRACDRRRCEREAALQGRAAPVAPRVLAVALDSARPEIEMELVVGIPLDEWFARGDEHALLDVARRLAAAVAHLHARGIVHRDLKPANILVEADGAIRLIDFGLAALSGDVECDRGAAITRSDERLGTPLYMAPEQIRRSLAIDPRTDVYALGGTLHALWCGAPPFPPESCIEGHLFRSPPPLGCVAPVDERLEELVAACLAKTPADRPTALEIVERVDRLLADPAPRAAARNFSSAPAPAPSARAAARAGEPAPACPAPPLVGRDPELRALFASAHRALAGRSELAVLAGAAGLGKSRLIDHLHGALAKDARWIRLDAAEIFRATGHFAGAALVAALDGEIAADAAPPSAERIAAAIDGAAAAGPLAISIDNAEHADDALLDALEQLALGGARRAWFLLACRPALCERRPHWQKSDAATRVALAPLDDGAAGRMLAALLRPIERVPDSLARRLLGEAGGVPAQLTALAEALRASGAVKRHQGASGWFVAAGELDFSGAAPLMHELAARTLAGAHPSLAELLTALAIAGPPISARDLQGVAARLAAPGGSYAAVSAVLPLLARAGILVEDTAGAWRFRVAGLGAAIAAAAPDGERARVHQAAYEWFAASEPGALDPARLGRHARATSRRDQAARWFQLAAARARAAHDYVAAEEALSIAVEECDDEALRGALLGERGRLRTRTERLPEAIADLRAARSIAERRGDRQAQAGLLLDEATAHDWQNDYPAADAAAADAASLAHGDARLDARLALARARSLYRAERFADAVPGLQAALIRARAAGDDETETVALVLLAYALSVTERFAPADARYAELFQLCDRTGDRFHRGVAHSNRVALHALRRDHRAALADLHAAAAIARELGHVKMESFSRINLAHLALWSGRLDEAWRAAQHGLALAALSQAQPEPEDTLLLARIAVARRDRAEARRLHDAIAGEVPRMKPSILALYTAVQLALDGVPARDRRWSRLVREAGDALLPDELAEIRRLSLRAGRAPAQKNLDRALLHQP